MPVKAEHGGTKLLPSSSALPHGAALRPGSRLDSRRYPTAPGWGLVIGRLAFQFVPTSGPRALAVLSSSTGLCGEPSCAGPWRTWRGGGTRRSALQARTLRDGSSRGKRSLECWARTRGALGPLQSSLGETALAPRKRPPFRPSPLMIQGQASRGTRGHSHRPSPTLLPAPPGIKMPQARAAEFYLFFTFYEPSTALATTSF